MSTDATPVAMPRKIVLRRVLMLTVVIELFTVALRYLIGLESTRDTASTIGVLTFGLRIHHGYVGLVLLALAWFLRVSAPRFAIHLFVWGWALVLSDAIHHFLVLWPIEGSPEFHFWYGDRANQ